MAAYQHNHAGQDNPILPEADIFNLVSETRKQVTEVAASARDAIKSHYADPVQLAAFIEHHQTPVYLCSNSLLTAMLLWVFGFELGFIPPSKDRRYRWLFRCLQFFHQKKKQGEKVNCHARHGLFVLTRPLFTVGFLSHQLHHWLACRAGMQGYCEQSQRLYREFWHKYQGQLGPDVHKMKPADMVALKEAINRDLEALQFLKSIAQEVLIPAKQARCISNGNASA